MHLQKTNWQATTAGDPKEFLESTWEYGVGWGGGVDYVEWLNGLRDSPAINITPGLLQSVVPAIVRLPIWILLPSEKTRFYDCSCFP